MNPRPQLKHVGLYVHDLARMEAFYADVFDLLVTDRGQVPRLGNRNIVFMSAAADAHRQMVLIDGKDPASGPSVVFQLSFYVQTLDELRRIDAKMRAQGVTDIAPITHGNAWSIYASDPEGNGLEAYLDTPWHVSQPHGLYPGADPGPGNLCQPRAVDAHTSCCIAGDHPLTRRPSGAKAWTVPAQGFEPLYVGPNSVCWVLHHKETPCVMFGQCSRARGVGLSGRKTATPSKVMSAPHAMPCSKTTPVFAKK